jgi:transposase
MEDHVMQQETMFSTTDSVPEAESRGVSGGVPRFQRADRQQMEWRALELDSLIPADHRARSVWAFVEQADLSALYERIRAVEGHAGRSPIDPRILLALWLYATVEGVGSARALAELCENHHAYQWLCGGVGVNYHTLADFRTGHAEVLDRLLTESTAVLMSQGLVELNRVAQDGMRVRASAGAASFRREPSLEACLKEAEEQVQRLRAEVEEDPGATSRRQQAARAQAAADRKARVEKALGQLPEVRAKKKAEDRSEARVSTTDPEARVMKMGDGGFRPAYNVQFATDTESQVIVGVGVVNAGSDQGQMAPMVEQIERRCGQAPKEMLVDGGFVKGEDIEKVSAGPDGTTVYAPVPRPKKESRDPHVPLPDDSEAVAAWRVRMGTPAAKEIYKERASTAECVNALARNRNLQRFLVRGLQKVRTVALWYALAHNMMRGWSLRETLAAVT